MKKILFLICIFFVVPVKGQGPYYLKFELSELAQPSIELPVAPLSYLDPSLVSMAIDSLIHGLRSAGYLDAALDSIALAQNITRAFINPGPLFQWRMQNSGISNEALRKTQMQCYFDGTLLPFGNLAMLQERLLQWYENHGYPFASLHIENIRIDSNTITARLQLEPKYLIHFEPLQLTGDVALADGFLRRHTGIVPGMPYSQEMAVNATARLNELTFAEVAGTPEVLFSPASARLSIPMRPKPANRFDGIAGFGSRPDAPGRLQFTGSLNLNLINMFRRAEQLMVNWQGPGHGTQRLSISANVPYIFSTPVTPLFQFSLHKQDSTFIQIGQTLSLEWMNLGWARLLVFVNQNNTQLLAAGRSNLNGPIHTLADSRAMFYGISGTLNTRGFFSNLMDGSFAEVTLSAGNKNIRTEAGLPEDVPTILQPNQNRVSLSFRGETRIPVSRLGRLVLSLHATSLAGPQLFLNEMHRIGGTKTLKGIDEEAILASSFSIASAEFRYFTGPNSFFSMLVNGAWYEKRLLQEYERGLPWGIAAGVTLQTRPGILSLFFALGDGPDTQFAFRNTKVHVGLTSLF